MLDLISKILASCPCFEKDEQGEVDWLSPRNIVALAGSLTLIIILLMVIRAFRRRK